MTDDKSLPGGQEKIIRAVERTLAASAASMREGVKITNLASGKVQVEVHAYDGDLTVAGNRARDEFNRQLGLESIPTEELERLKWLASIGKVALEKSGGVVPDEVEPTHYQTSAGGEFHPLSDLPGPPTGYIGGETSDPQTAPEPEPVAHKRRESVIAVEGPSDADLLARLTEINMAGVEVSDV
jgi:hypothetical protein